MSPSHPDRVRKNYEDLSNTVKHYEPRYSGPGKTGFCVCGEHWTDHVLVRNESIEAVKQTGEFYIPGESNKCSGYQDKGRGL